MAKDITLQIWADAAGVSQGVSEALREIQRLRAGIAAGTPTNQQGNRISSPAATGQINALQRQLDIQNQVMKTYVNLADAATRTQSVRNRAEENVTRKMQREAQAQARAMVTVQQATMRNVQALRTLGYSASSAGNQLVFLGGVGVAVMTKFGTNALKAAGKMEQSGIAFATMLKNTTAAKDLLDDLSKFTFKSPFVLLGGLTDATQRLLAYGFAAKDIIPTLTILGDTVSALGRGQKGLSQIVATVGKGKARGKFGAREVFQLSNQGIAARSILQQQMGLTFEGFNEALRKGIPQHTAINALFAGLKERFGGGMLAQTKSLFGIASNLEDVWNRFMTTPKGTGVGDYMLKVLQPAAMKLFLTLEKMDESGETARIAKSIGTSLGSMASSFMKFAQYVAEHGEKVAQVLKFAGVASAITLLTGLMLKMVGVWATVISSLKQIALMHQKNTVAINAETIATVRLTSAQRASAAGGVIGGGLRGFKARQAGLRAESAGAKAIDAVSLSRNSSMPFTYNRSLGRDIDARGQMVSRAVADKAYTTSVRRRIEAEGALAAASKASLAAQKAESAVFPQFIGPVNKGTYAVNSFAIAQRGAKASVDAMTKATVVQNTGLKAGVAGALSMAGAYKGLAIAAILITAKIAIVAAIAYGAWDLNILRMKSSTQAFIGYFEKNWGGITLIFNNQTSVMGAHFSRVWGGMRQRVDALNKMITEVSEGTIGRLENKLQTFRSNYENKYINGDPDQAPGFLGSLQSIVTKGIAHTFRGGRRANEFFTSPEGGMNQNTQQDRLNKAMLLLAEAKKQPYWSKSKNSKLQGFLNENSGNSAVRVGARATTVENFVKGLETSWDAYNRRRNANEAKALKIQTDKSNAEITESINNADKEKTGKKRSSDNIAGNMAAVAELKLVRGTSKSFVNQCQALVRVTSEQVKNFPKVVSSQFKDSATETMRSMKKAGVGRAYKPGEQVPEGWLLYRDTKGGHAAVSAGGGNIYDQHAKYDKKTGRSKLRRIESMNPNWVVPLEGSGDESLRDWKSTLSDEKDQLERLQKELDRIAKARTASFTELKKKMVSMDTTPVGQMETKLYDIRVELQKTIDTATAGESYGAGRDNKLIAYAKAVAAKAAEAARKEFTKLQQILRREISQSLLDIDKTVDGVARAAHHRLETERIAFERDMWTKENGPMASYYIEQNRKVVRSRKADVNRQSTIDKNAPSIALADFLAKRTLTEATGEDATKVITEDMLSVLRKAQSDALDQWELENIGKPVAARTLFVEQQNDELKGYQKTATSQLLRLQAEVIDQKIEMKELDKESIAQGDFKLYVIENEISALLNQAAKLRQQADEKIAKGLTPAEWRRRHKVEGDTNAIKSEVKSHNEARRKLIEGNIDSTIGGFSNAVVGTLTGAKDSWKGFYNSLLDMGKSTAAELLAMWIKHHLKMKVLNAAYAKITGQVVDHTKDSTSLPESGVGSLIPALVGAAGGSSGVSSVAQGFMGGIFSQSQQNIPGNPMGAKGVPVYITNLGGLAGGGGGVLGQVLGTVLGGKKKGGGWLDWLGTGAGGGRIKNALAGGLSYAGATKTPTNAFGLTSNFIPSFSTGTPGAGATSGAGVAGGAGQGLMPLLMGVFKKGGWKKLMGSKQQIGKMGGGVFGSALSGFGIGSMLGGGLGSGVGGALGGVFSKAILGKLGLALGPFGFLATSLLGGLVGKFLGGLFKKKPKKNPADMFEKAMDDWSKKKPSVSQAVQQKMFGMGGTSTNANDFNLRRRVGAGALNRTQDNSTAGLVQHNSIVINNHNTKSDKDMAQAIGERTARRLRSN